MGIDPRRPSEPPAYDVEERVEETTVCAPDLPYSSAGHRSVLGDDVHHFLARDGATAVGHAVLDIDGETGGIYDMGVAPHARRRGYGRALAFAAVACARESGCSSVTLNATGEGESLYRGVGFESLGHGMTWFLFPARSS